MFIEQVCSVFYKFLDFLFLAGNAHNGGCCGKPLIKEFRSEIGFAISDKCLGEGHEVGRGFQLGLARSIVKVGYLLLILFVE